MTLHDKILNIPCEVDKTKKAINRLEYKNGHRDALSKAAELAIKYDAKIDRMQESLLIIAEGKTPSKEIQEKFTQLYPRRAEYEYWKSIAFEALSNVMPENK